MLLPWEAPLGDAVWPDPCRDRIEQQIICAYVRLAAPASDDGISRTVTVTRLGSVELRLTEAPLLGLPDVPLFWLEVHSHLTGSTVDSLGCFEFDEDELAAAVDFVCEAQHLHQTRH
jgi:hypothetical protein